MQVRQVTYNVPITNYVRNFTLILLVYMLAWQTTDEIVERAKSHPFGYSLPKSLSKMI